MLVHFLHKFLVSLIMVFVVGWLIIPSFAHASFSEFSGFAWSGGVTTNPPGYDGMGWTSFSSRDCDADNNGTIDVPACGSGSIPRYGVTMPFDSGDLTGYAWNENYGWVSFNTSELVGCPQAPCTATRVSNKLVGWARILSIRDAGSNAGGWQGWIQLDPKDASGVPIPGSGLTIDTSGTSPFPIRGYAYSDELGWIQFDPPFGGVRATGPPASLTVCPPNPIVPDTTSTYQMHAYYRPSSFTSITCSNYPQTGDVEVTAAQGINWTSSNMAVATIGSGTGLATVNGDGTTTMTGSYAGLMAASNVTVECVPAPGSCPVSTAATTCSTDTFPYSYTDSCHVNRTIQCPGTRNCDTNWKEVTPR